MRIGILDSGVGGLTILKTLLEKCPNHEYIYFGDNINIPYGEKNKDEIVKLTNKIISFLDNENVDIIILGCVTMSSNKKYLKSKHPIIDIISPLKGKLDNYNLISIMATSFSIKVNLFENYIKSKKNLISCSNLASLIEEENYSKINQELKNILKSTYESDALILGCTHYPLIKERIQKYFNKDIICLDEYIVPIVEKLEESNKKSVKIYFSKVNDKLIKRVKNILVNQILEIERKCI